MVRAAWYPDGARYVAIRAHNLSAPIALMDLVVAGADAEGQVSGNGRSILRGAGGNGPAAAAGAGGAGGRAAPSAPTCERDGNPGAAGASGSVVDVLVVE